MAKTIQLRRYQIAPGMLEEFRAWLNKEVLPIRKQFGFDVEFMYVDNQNHEFIWAVSVQGSPEDFLEVQTRYDASDARELAGTKKPDCLLSVDVKFVEEN